jgi:hypothetical protein
MTNTARVDDRAWRHACQAPGMRLKERFDALKRFATGVTAASDAP